MLKALCQKFQERTPLKSIVIRSAVSLSPCNMAKSLKVSPKKFEKLVDHLHEKQHISSQQCSDSKSQYSKFLGDVIKANKESFGNFDSNVTQVDQFLCTFLNGAKEFKSLWLVYKFVFTLSHGQARIKQGFSISKDALYVNMEKTYLNARRTVYDHMICSNVNVSEFVVKKGLTHSCKAAHSKYTAHLQETRKERTKEKEGNKRKLLQEELATVKRKKLELEAVVSSLQQDIEKYSIEAAEKEDLKEMQALIIKANSFQTTVKEKLVTINDLEKVS